MAATEVAALMETRIRYPDGKSEDSAHRLERIAPLLACPNCRRALRFLGDYFECGECTDRFPVRGVTPVLLPQGVADPGAAQCGPDDRVSRHPYSANAEEVIAAHPEGWVLDLGSGGKEERRINVLQVDIFRYPSVDVVASADCLPFLDNTFDAVISQAVFEHLQYPEWAVREIRRVLKPGGVAKIDTAFLQPEHGYPHHFFNATESGLLHWFRDFDVQWQGVEPFQHPKWALHWFLGVYLDYIGQKHATPLRAVSVGDLTDALQRHAIQGGLAQDAEIINALDAIPEHLLRVLAAGVSIYAVNPPKYDIATGSAVSSSVGGLGREREMLQLRADKQRIQSDMATLRESLRVAKDKADYLVQFYPGCQNHAQFAAQWIDAGPSGVNENGAEARHPKPSNHWQPFASVALIPTSVGALLDTFFSLIEQDYGGWELILILAEHSDMGVARASNALAKLDRRVVVRCLPALPHPKNLLAMAQPNGEYGVSAPAGLAFVSCAITEVMGVARNIPGVQTIFGDYCRPGDSETDPMQCFTLLPDDMVAKSAPAIGFPGCFHRLRRGSSPDATLHRAHIPKLLVQLPRPVESQLTSLKAGYCYLLDRYRAVEQELRAVSAEAPRLGEIHQVHSDVVNYLSEYFFDPTPERAQVSIRSSPLGKFRSHAGRWVRKNVSLGTLRSLARFVGPRLRATQTDNCDATRQPRPFLSIVMRPDSAKALLQVFFSLVRQTYTGWELVIVLSDESSAAVRRAVHDLSARDARLHTLNKGSRSLYTWSDLHHHLSGRYCVALEDGVSLAFDAVERLVALVAATDGDPVVFADFDHISSVLRRPMHCYNQPVLEAVLGDEICFDAVFRPTRSLVDSANSTFRNAEETARIPVCLFHCLAQDAFQL